MAAKNLKANLKPTSKTAPVKVEVAAPNVEVAAPVIDLRGMTDAVNALSAIVTQLAKQQEAILKSIKEQCQVMQVMAHRETYVQMPDTPLIAPKAPADYEVVIHEDSDGETRMRIKEQARH